MSSSAATCFLACLNLHFWFLKAIPDVAITYVSVGGTVILSPNPAVDHISSLTWKNEPNLAMEWYGKEVYAFRHFKERGELNVTSGDMTLTGLTMADSGLYTSLVNDITASQTRLEVIVVVGKPTLTVSCDKRDKCLLVCRGSTSGAGPFSFSWDVDGAILQLPTEVVLTQESPEQLFTCVLNNPVSSARSDTVRNPFKRSGYGIYGSLVLYTGAMLWLIIQCYVHLKRSTMNRSIEII